MGFLYLLGVVHSLKYFPPFTLEIIAVAILIILLACPVPLAEYYEFINEYTSHACQTLALTADEDVGEPSVVKKPRSKRSSRHNLASKCDVPKVLQRTTSLIKSIESTLKNIDRTNNDIIVNNLDICNQISDTTFARAFQLDDVDRYKDDCDVAEKGDVDLGETGTEPLSDVDAGVYPRVLDGVDVDSEDSNVSNDSDNSVASDEHGSVVSDGDEQTSITGDGVSVTALSSAEQPITLRRTDEITHLSGILVASPDEVNDESTTPLTKEFSLTDLILEEKLDLSMIRERADSFKRRLNGDDGEDSGCVSSESESTDDDLFLERRHKMDDKESDSGLLDNVLNGPCNTERPRRSLDTLQGEVDYEDMESISNEDLESNKQFFVDNFINDEEIKNHARFARSKRKIFIEEIPIDNEKEDHGSFGALDTLIESDLEAEDKYVNSKFIMNDFSSDSDFHIPGGVGNAVLEEGNNVSGACRLDTGRSGVCVYDALTKISEENIEMKETARYKSFSTLSDFKTKDTVLEKVRANSEAIICDDIFVKRYDTILDYAVNAHGTSAGSNPFLNAINSSPVQDLYMNKLIKGEDSDILESENIMKLNNTFKESADIGVANVSTPIPIPSLNKQHAHSQFLEKDFGLENDVTKLMRKQECELSEMPSRCRLIFGTQVRPRPSSEDVLPKTGSQDAGTANSSGLSGDNSCWKFRENVRAKKIVFDKDTFLRRKDASFHVFSTNSGSMNNLFELSEPSFISNNVYDVSSQCGSDVASTSYVENGKDEEESDYENEPSTSAEATKLRHSRTSLPKFKLLVFKTKSREKSNSESSQKLSGNDLTEKLSLSKSRSKTSKRSKVFNKKDSVDSKEEQRCSVEEDGSSAGTSEIPDEEYEDVLDSNTFTKLFHKITRKLKGNNSKVATTTTTTRRENNKNMAVQNKVYVFKGNQKVAAFPTEDPLVMDRNVRSLDYFYSELQSDHHSLKITANKTNIPASGSSTDANTDLHLAPLMEDIDE